MLALIQDTPPALALLAIAGVAAFFIGCRALVTCWLGLAAIRAAKPKDLAQTLEAVREVVDAAFRLKR